VTELTSQEVLCVSRMNGKQGKRLHEALIKKGGNVCQNCGALGIRTQLIKDHIDNNNSNNNLENLQLLCRSCNYSKDSRKSIDMCVRSPPPISQNSSLSVNREKEPKFRKWILEELERKGAVDGAKVYSECVINAGAEKVGISPETVKRYLKKMCSNAGQLETSYDFREGQLIGIKPLFVPKIVL